MQLVLAYCCVAAAASAATPPQKAHVVLHAPDAKRAQPSLAALKEHAVTVVHRGGDIGEAARTAATTADTIILYDARHAPLQHTMSWNATIKNAKACAALLPDDVERVGTARRANGIVLSNREARKASGATVADILTNIKCRVAPMPSDDDHELPYRKPEPRSIQRRLHEHGSGDWFDDYYEDPLRDVRDTPGRSLALLLGYDVTTKIDPFSSRPISRDEAFCLLAHAPRIAFLGDSLTRFHFFTLNEWLSTGKLQTHLYSKWGNGDGSIHYDTSDRWTHTSSSKHAQHFKKSIPLTSRAQAMCGNDLGVTEIETEYWFLADWHHVEIDAVPLFENTIAPWASMVIVNSGWWELKRCSCDHAYGRDDTCRKEYRDVLEQYATSLLDKVPYPYIRLSSCCGEYTEQHCDGDPVYEDRSMWPDGLADIYKHESNKGVLAFNEVLRDFAIEKKYRHFDPHPFANLQNIYDRTIDGSHPVQPLYHLWNQYLLSSIKGDGRIFPVVDGVRSSDKYKVLSEALPSSCADGMLSKNESDIDCGGVCPACSAGQRCYVDSDCVSSCSYNGDKCEDAPTARESGMCTCDAVPTRAPVTHNDDNAEDEKPAWIEDDDIVGYGTSSATSDILGDKAIREGGPGSCAVPEDNEDASWRQAWKRTRKGLKKMLKKGACALGPGPRVLLFLLFGILGAAIRASLARRTISSPRRSSIELTPMSNRPASPTNRVPCEEEGSPLLNALELALWLFIAAYCDQLAPTGLLPAGTLTLSENPDLWVGAMVLLLLISYSPRLTRTTDNTFFSRHQCNEWKGWMQIAFVAYHYANAQDFYVSIRWFVSAYVWLTGFGNATYFLNKDDFSLSRFLKMIWRINFFVVFLSLATGTKWIAYYVVALHTVHFVLCFVSFGFSKLMLRNEEPGSILRIVFALVYYLIVVTVIWEFGLYHVTIKPVLLYCLGEGFEEYFWFRTRMDYLSSWFGALAAVLMPVTVKGWQSSYKGLILCISSILFALGVWAWASHPTSIKYREIAPYVGTLWVPLYAVLRNATPHLRSRVSVPLEWLGARSLELYLLQFHLLMNRSAGRVLWLIPDVNWPVSNLILCACLWMLAASRCFANTASLRDAAEGRPRPVAVALALLCMTYITARLFDAPCVGDGLTMSFFALGGSTLGGYVLADCARRCASEDVSIRYSVSATEDADECLTPPGSPSIIAEVATPEQSRPSQGLV